MGSGSKWKFWLFSQSQENQAKTLVTTKSRTKVINNNSCRGFSNIWRRGFAPAAAGEPFDLGWGLASALTRCLTKRSNSGYRELASSYHRNRLVTGQATLRVRLFQRYTCTKGRLAKIGQKEETAPGPSLDAVISARADPAPT